MYKTFEEVKEALKQGVTLYYHFDADDEYGDVTLDGDKIMVEGLYSGPADIEEENQDVINIHNEDLKNYGPDSFEDPQYKKEWKTWEDISDCEFHYTPDLFVKRKRR